MPKAYSGTANSTASACTHVARKCCTFVGGSTSRSGSKGGRPRADSSSRTLMPVRAATRAAARSAELLSELRRRLPEIARITYDLSLSIFVPTGARTYQPAPKSCRSCPVVCPGFVSCTNR